VACAQGDCGFAMKPIHASNSLHFCADSIDGIDWMAQNG
jgi:hypothetical protein